MDRIVYVSQSEDSDIWIMDMDGTNKTALTDDEYYNIEPVLVYVPPPQISDMQPSGTIDNNVPTIGANFSCSYGNVSAVNLSVNGIDVTPDAMITYSNVSYVPIEPLDCDDHDFMVQVESDRYTVGYGYETFTIAYITNPQPRCVYTNTPTISANISVGYGDIATVAISVDGVNVTPDAMITESCISYTPTEPLSNGTHNVTVCVNSTYGINDSRTWVFYVNECHPSRSGGGGGGGGYYPKIVFASNRSGNFDIWIMNMDGTGLIQLTDSPSNETHPAVVYSTIVYVSDESGNYDLWAMNLDGSNKQQLTSSAADECM
ncbi:MAG: PD40 domain-containing protein, partial [Methanosarcinales archaeon]|nr:PD40 domain-containing protein [Methanosarcinales archaeon]